MRYSGERAQDRFSSAARDQRRAAAVASYPGVKRDCHDETDGLKRYIAANTEYA